MKDFIFNPCSVPISDKEDSIAKAKDVFSALIEYINGSQTSLCFDRALETLFLSTDYSLIDYFDDIKSTDKEFALSLIEVIDSSQTISCQDFEYHTLKIGDDTRFNCNAIKYACINNLFLFSITNDHFWEREKIDCSVFYDGNCCNKELYNLFSKNYSYLPTTLPPFTLKNEDLFTNTGKHIKGAVIRKEKQTNRYWYIDTLHIGDSMHYEVFDPTGKKHLGEANMDGILDTSKADASKHIDNII